MVFGSCGGKPEYQVDVKNPICVQIFVSHAYLHTFITSTVVTESAKTYHT